MWRNSSYSLRIPRNLGKLEGRFFCEGGGSFLGRDRRADGQAGRRAGGQGKRQGRRADGVRGSGRSGFED